MDPLLGFCSKHDMELDHEAVILDLRSSCHRVHTCTNVWMNLKNKWEDGNKSFRKRRNMQQSKVEDSAYLQFWQDVVYVWWKANIVLRTQLNTMESKRRRRLMPYHTLSTWADKPAVMILRPPNYLANNQEQMHRSLFSGKIKAPWSHDTLMTLSDGSPAFLNQKCDGPAFLIWNMLSAFPVPKIREYYYSYVSRVQI